MPELRTRIIASLGVAAIASCGPIGVNVLEPGDAPAGDAGTAARDGGGGSGIASRDASAPDGGQGAGIDAPPGPTAPGGYSVSGNTIYTADRVPHLFHGLDRPSLEWAAQGEELSAEDYQRMASWKANVARLSLSQGFWLQGSKAHVAGYRATVDQNVKWAHAAGLDVILDLHWSDRGDFGTDPAQQRMADAHSVAFWKEVADAYKNDGRVLFELYNEPHDVGWEVWQHGGASGDGYTVAGMQEMHDTIRSTGAENLVLIGGLSYAYDLSGVTAHRIQGHNIVYVTHPYNQPGKQRGNWDNGFGQLATTDPVIATEFGDTSGCSDGYYSDLVAYMDAHRVSWTGWAWYVSGCSFPSLISDWAGTPTAAGKVVKSALAKY